MAKKKNETSINLKILAVEILESSLIAYENNSSGQLKTFHYNIKLTQRYDPDKKIVFVLPLVDIIHEDKQTKLGSIKINCVFKIEEFEDYYDSKTKKVNFPENVIKSLNSVSLSTCRGFMASHFKGTALHNAFLPLIDTDAITLNQTN